MSRRKRIAVAGFLHETNTFLPTTTGYREFSVDSPTGRIYRDMELYDLLGTNSGFSGFAAQFPKRGFEIVPMVWCEAEPGGYVTEDAYDRITSDLTHRLRQAGSIDGIYLELHGAMVTTSTEDADTETVNRVRTAVGPEVPIVVSLDLHGNITPGMVAACDGLSGYRTYPHVDMAATGARAARQLRRLLQDRETAFGAHVAIPWLLGLHEQATLDQPAADIYACLERLESELGVDLSFFMGFGAADTYWTGASVVAFAPTPARARTAVRHLSDHALTLTGAFNAPVATIDEAIEKAIAHDDDRPLALAEIQDNPGGGGYSDTMSLVEALFRSATPGVAVSAIWDPEAIDQIRATGKGRVLELSLGGKHGYGTPLLENYEIVDICEGRFKASGSMATGFVFDLGIIAVLRLGSIRIVVSQKRVQNLDLGFFTAAGIDPTQQRILVVKSTVHYRAAYEPIISRFINVCTPGGIPARPSQLPYRNLRRELGGQANIES